MITFKDIQLEDKPIFDQYFSTKHYENSEFSFTNMFIWRMSYRFKFTQISDHLCVMGEYRGKYPFIFSPLSLSNPDYQMVLPMLAEIFHSKGYPLVLKSVPEQQKNEIEAALPGRIIFREDRNNFDYVYLSRDLIELKGKKFRKKRNHINRFLKSYNYQYEELSDSNLEECLKTEQQWLSQQGDAQDESILEEKQAVGEIINNFYDLELTGGVIRINGKVRAFSLGELLNPDMAVIHIEKANTDYVGSFNMINRMFALHAWSEVTYINREEDMGILGLRKAKESYNPVKMIKKYTGFYIKEGA